MTSRLVNVIFKMDKLDYLGVWKIFFKVFFCYRTCSPGKWIHDWLFFHHSFLLILGQCVRCQWLICRSPNLPKCSHLPRAFWNICEIIMCGLFWAVQDLLVGQVNKETGTIPWTTLQTFYVNWRCAMLTHTHIKVVCKNTLSMRYHLRGSTNLNTHRLF